MSWRFTLGAVAAVTAAGALLGGGYKLGDANARAEQAELRLKDSEATLRQVRTLVQNADRIAEAYASRERVIHTQTTTILTETRDAISPETDARFSLPWGFIRLHDSAAAGSLLPEPPGEPDAAASDVALSAASETITLNYGACTEDRARLTALQDWARMVTTENDR